MKRLLICFLVLFILHGCHKENELQQIKEITYRSIAIVRVYRYTPECTEIGCLKHVRNYTLIRKVNEYPKEECKGLYQRIYDWPSSEYRDFYPYTMCDNTCEGEYLVLVDGKISSAFIAHKAGRLTVTDLIKLGYPLDQLEMFYITGTGKYDHVRTIKFIDGRIIELHKLNRTKMKKNERIDCTGWEHGIYLEHEDATIYTDPCNPPQYKLIFTDENVTRVSYTGNSIYYLLKTKKVKLSELERLGMDIQIEYTVKEN